MILWLIFIILAIFAAVALVGAPYVPTHKASIEKALDMLPLKPGDTVIDLGSGDGAFLLAAARRGYKSIGYEINPILCLASWFRCWQVRQLVKIKPANFWNVKLPKQVKAVFVFAAGPFMDRLAKKLDLAMVERAEPLYVISYGFALPKHDSVEFKSGLHLYKLEPAKR